MNKILVILCIFIIALSGCTSEVQNETENQVETSEDHVASKTIGIGETVNVDDISYVVDKVETYTAIGSELVGKETNGLFYKVYLTATNNGKESTNLFLDRFKIVDGDGLEYSSDIEAEVYAEDTLMFGEQLQPRLPYTGSKIFELPKDAKNLHLEIRGDWLSTTEVIVDLEETKVIAKGRETSRQDEVNEALGFGTSNEGIDEGREILASVTNSGVTLELNSIKFEDKGGWGKVNELGLSVINEKNDNLWVQYDVFIQDKEDPDTKDVTTPKWDEYDTILAKGEHISKTYVTDISVAGTDKDKLITIQLVSENFPRKVTASIEFETNLNDWT